MEKRKPLAALNIVFFIVACAVSNLSSFKIFRSRDIGSISDKFGTIFAPTGITFSIWGVIYISLLGFCIYHLRKAYSSDANKESTTEILQINWLFIINNLAVAAWVFAWLYEKLAISVILMLIQLITLLLINIRLSIYDPSRSANSRIFTQWPLSIYFAWICIATIANISTWLVSIGWRGMGISDSYWTIIMIGIASLITLFVVLVRRNVFFGLVVIWALYGIVLKRNEVNGQLYHDVILACWGGIVFIALAAIIQLYKNTRSGSSHVEPVAQI
ncbi:hypothetical protein GS399_09575 [Pedobacter sp. HMF7647]|uniref:Tryptophan-rich sensory protein n=1 Tax=Hufsiella arboris TaxID=2695275 RepID=A0A7K1Y9F5_9SPHI|nr:hypothetical protein [Hufsiella arboris]MXV51217.1 hypothetical protein [Hufsiella arboris]